MMGWMNEWMNECSSACLLPSNDSTRLAWQTRSQFPSPHRDHSSHILLFFWSVCLSVSTHGCVNKDYHKWMNKRMNKQINERTQPVSQQQTKRLTMKVSCRPIWTACQFSSSNGRLVSTTRFGRNRSINSSVPIHTDTQTHQQGFNSVCSSTQKWSSKEICAVLLSKMCSWWMDNISLKQCKFLVLKQIFQQIQICYKINR